MLAPEDRKAIEGLFDRLDTVAGQNPDRDPDAVALIEQRIAQDPAAPYYMAQTVLVQEHALSVAQDRIAELEEQLAQRPAGGGLFGGLFGGGQAPARRSAPRPAPMPGQSGQQGGFLAGAAQTALGVTGGVLLGSAIAGMLSPGQATADEEPAPEEDYGGGHDDLGGMDDMEF